MKPDETGERQQVLAVRIIDLVAALFLVLLIAAVVQFGLELIAANLGDPQGGWLRNWMVWVALTVAVSVSAVPVLMRHWRRLRTGFMATQGDEEGEAEDGAMVLAVPEKRALSEVEGELSGLASNGESDVDVVPLIDKTLSQAIAQNASDVHFEPSAKSVAVRYRIDGTLVDVAQLPVSLQLKLVNRIKVMARLSTFERMTPQDGRIFAKIGGQSFDIRASLLPTIHGEKVVLRIFQARIERFDLDSLRLNRKLRERYADLLSRPQGIIFVTGPTGSGKTTTMYASLRHVKNHSRGMTNIVTIEDPVEFAIPEFSQTQVNEDVGLSFSKGLRTILRQDPDVIMLGEIRDVETAQVALQAGLTGHLMLTTVHADSTAGVFSRMMNMGVEPFLLASSAIGVLSQRLVRELCPSCRRITPLSEAERRMMAEGGMDLSTDATFYTGRGCPECLNTGFKGRAPLAELMLVDESVKQAIIDKVPSSELMRVAGGAGMETLLECGLAKALQGETTVAEVFRVAR